MDKKTITDLLETIRIPDEMAGALYQFNQDKKASDTLNLIPAVPAIARQVINLVSSVTVGSNLMEAVKVGPEQFPWLHLLATKAAMVLHTDLPPLFVRQDAHANAYTFGVDEHNASIVLSSGLLEIMTPHELLFVIGHELGHFHCQHVLYHMLAKVLSGGFKFLVVRNPLLDLALKAASATAGLAIYAWARRSEISADRAGLIVCQDYKVAAASLAKLSAGVSSEKINIEAYLRQIEELREQWSNVMVQAGELFDLHPYLPKRIAALDSFQDTKVFMRVLGTNGDDGRTLASLDDEVSTLLFSGERQSQ